MFLVYLSHNLSSLQVFESDWSASSYYAIYFIVYKVNNVIYVYLEYKTKLQIRYHIRTFAHFNFL